MERSPIIKMKAKLISRYLSEENREDATRIQAKTFEEPAFDVKIFHPEEEPRVESINNMMREVVLDLNAVQEEMSLAADKISALIGDSKTRLLQVDKEIEREEERLQDLNSFCGKNSGFVSVRSLDTEDFLGDASYEDGVFMSRTTRKSDVALDVINVEGNGHEGNEFVFRNGKFLMDTVSTGNRRFLTDAKTSTAYEYSRLSASPGEKNRFSLLNYDNNEAECTITVRASREISFINLDSDDNAIIITSLRVSDDNITYREVMSDPVKFKEKREQYPIGKKYIYGTGILSFPSSRYLKISLKSKGYTEDTIAFVKILAAKEEEHES